MKSAPSGRDRCGGHSRPQNSLCGHYSRGRQLGRFKFVRQEAIDRYYVDFACRERRLIIELDGGQHAERTKDRQRDSIYARSAIA
jgi:very-short-patch-repair endonuclease